MTYDENILKIIQVNIIEIMSDIACPEPHNYVSSLHWMTLTELFVKKC